MDFTEEKTPSGYILKILFDNWNYLAFNRKGVPVYADEEGRSLLHKVPIILFLGTIFNFERDYDREYNLLKIREGQIILPYRNIVEKKRKFIFIPVSDPMDMTPALIKLLRSYSIFLKEIPAGKEIDYLIIDDSISETELAVIQSRYKPGKILNIHSNDENENVSEKGSEPDYININTLSDNPVFLTTIHLRNMALSNINQILLDFDISAFDTQYIIFFINKTLTDENNEDAQKNNGMLTDLKNSFEFYLALIERNEEVIKNKISVLTDRRKLAPYRTLVSKVRDMNPGREEQLLYTEYENMVLERREELA